MVRDYDARLRQNGLDLGTYFKYTGLTLETLREQMRPQAEQQVKVRLALEKIASLENLTVTDEELETEYNNISTAYNVPLDEVKKMILAEDLKADVLVGHAMKLVRENAKIGKAKKASAKKATKTEAEAPAEEKKPARKPRAKKATTESAE
jgi:trigger factor